MFSFAPLLALFVGRALASDPAEAASFYEVALEVDYITESLSDVSGAFSGLTWGAADIGLVLQVEGGQLALVLDVVEGGAVRSVRAAFDDEGTAWTFSDGAVANQADGSFVVALSGRGSDGATIAARVEGVRSGAELDVAATVDLASAAGGSRWEARRTGVKYGQCWVFSG